MYSHSQGYARRELNEEAERRHGLFLDILRLSGRW